MWFHWTGNKLRWIFQRVALSKRCQPNIGYLGPEILEGGRLKGAFENTSLRLLIARNGRVYRGGD
jgi:hypothetical protein